MKLLLAFVLFLPIAGKADDSLNRIRHQLSLYKVVEGSFDQVRTVKDLKVKLHSSGDFRFELPLELSWNQLTPFILDLKMSPDKLVQKGPNGTEEVMTKENQPVVFMFSSSFLGIFSGDEKKISENFTHEIFWSGPKWKMTLVPKAQLFKKVISRVLIEGSQFVDGIEVLEKSGGSTKITFTKVRGQ